ncbi:MAG: 3-deoxy-8-phosphooctulonate synthase, partial [Bacteroidales bacterium]|nr:3-deoxy-8-phosphooctulonate synthase [Bacteroidales bacterium]
MELYKELKDITNNFFLIAGPCVIENETQPFEIAEQLIEITNRLGLKLVFKASYRKANRSKLDSFTGIGDKKGLEILQQIRQTYSLPVITDIHSAQEAEEAAK